MVFWSSSPGGILRVGPKRTPFWDPLFRKIGPLGPLGRVGSAKSAFQRGLKNGSQNESKTDPKHE